MPQKSSSNSNIEAVIIGGTAIGVGAILAKVTENFKVYSQGYGQPNIVIPLRSFTDPTDSAVTHITGIDHKIGDYNTVGLIDSGTSFPAISQQTAKEINFESFPLDKDSPPPHSNKDPGIRLLPLEIPGLGIFPTPFLVGQPVQPTLIPPDIWYNWYDVHFTAGAVIFKSKSYGTVTPYIEQKQDAKSILMPGKKPPIIPFSVDGVAFQAMLDTGTNLNEISKQTASNLQIERYTSKRIVDGSSFVDGYRVPVAVPQVGLVEMDLGVTDTPYNVISAEQFLRTGFHVTFTSEGIRVGYPLKQY